MNNEEDLINSNDAMDLNKQNLLYLQKINNRKFELQNTIIDEAEVNIEKPVVTSKVSSKEHIEVDLSKDEPRREKSKDMTSFKRSAVALTVICVVGGSFLGLGLGVGTTLTNKYLLKENRNKMLYSSTLKDQLNPNIESDIVTLTDITDLKGNKNLLIDIIKSVNPSVVNISSRVSSNNPFEAGGGKGTGIIFNSDDENMYIVTNYHVVRGAKEVEIIIEDSKPIYAKLVGRDQNADIAVVSISIESALEAGVNKISTVEFGNSETLQVGELVLAIGNALGEGNTSTLGIISATNKEIEIDNVKLKVIQTDAAINSGNSGGPLINMNGEVIGINTAKVNDSKVEGMGYSITSNEVIRIVEEIMNSEPRPFLGVSGVDMQKHIARSYNLPVIGVIVTGVVEGTPAEKAGIQESDIITSFNGETVNTFDDLLRMIKDTPLGQRVEVNLIRNGRDVITVTVKLDQTAENNF
jgi:serine protease Do